LDISPREEVEFQCPKLLLRKNFSIKVPGVLVIVVQM
jgi:hypothetical protein